MKNKKQVSYGILTGLMVVAYCSLIAAFMYNIDRLFDNDNAMVAIVTMLLLLVVSAAITGALVFAYPAYLFIKKEFKQGIYALASNLASILIFGLVVIGLILIIFYYI